MQGFARVSKTDEYSEKTRNFAIKLRTFSMRTFAFYPNVRNVLWNALWGKYLVTLPFPALPLNPCLIFVLICFTGLFFTPHVRERTPLRIHFCELARRGVATSQRRRNDIESPHPFRNDNMISSNGMGSIFHLRRISAKRGHWLLFGMPSVYKLCP